MRRIAREDLGVDVEISVGQPPFEAEIEGRTVELRYFFCAVATGEPIAPHYSELRWILRGQLLEYEFDPPSQPVVKWLLD